MTLKNFLKMHDGGVACVSVRQMPLNRSTHDYAKTYFNESRQEDMMATRTFKQIANKQVDHFNVIGGGGYKVELCIYLAEED